jgi:hypothetical protein
MSTTKLDRRALQMVIDERNAFKAQNQELLEALHLIATANHEAHPIFANWHGTESEFAEKLIGIARAAYDKVTEGEPAEGRNVEQPEIERARRDVADNGGAA